MTPFWPNFIYFFDVIFNFEVIFTVFIFESFCQAQFQLASQVTSWTEISLKFDYYHPHPPTPGKVEMKLEIDHIYGQWVASG